MAQVTGLMPELVPGMLQSPPVYSGPSAAGAVIPNIRPKLVLPPHHPPAFAPQRPAILPPVHAVSRDSIFISPLGKGRMSGREYSCQNHRQKPLEFVSHRDVPPSHWVAPASADETRRGGKSFGNESNAHTQFDGGLALVFSRLRFCWRAWRSSGFWGLALR
jgi:hypothetical protein